MTKPRIVQKALALWAWALKNKLLILAGVLTGGEALVTLGIPLPGADYIPVKYRGAAIALVMMGAFVARILAQRKENRDASR